VKGALLLALLLRVEVLGLLHPREAFITAPEGQVHALAVGDRVRFDGALQAGPAALLRLHAGPSPLAVRARGLPAPRAFPGALEVSARDGVLHFVSEAPLEEYVAGVVEAELGAGAPPAALEALSVVVRSFALSRSEHAAEAAAPAAAHRHRMGAPLCDQTHCQVYQGRATLRGALEAARRTAGEVLLLSSGGVAPALHHAACGGRTAGAGEVWPGASAADEEAGVAVDDSLPGEHGQRARAACAARPGELPLTWDLALDEPALARALGAPRPLALTSEAGPAGLLLRLHAAGLGVLTAEQVHLRLGRALGWNRARSPRFSFREAPPEAGRPRRWTLAGQGHGHGVGLCQRGASARATRGADRHQLLTRYFPGLRVGPLPRGSGSQ
jgi:stage II sporulation protein D